MKITASIALLEQLAHEQRRILSSWRSLVLLRRATFTYGSTERRWENLPEYPEDLFPLLRQMRNRGEIAPIKGFHHLYKVTVPYARQGIVDEREILFEIHPYAVLSHSSAISFHGLTEDLPKGLTATISADVKGELLPIGTSPRDWEGVIPPNGRTVKTILGRPIQWLRVKPERFFGFAEYEPSGYPVRYTTLERTLIDGLQHPQMCGGIVNVLRAWGMARTTIDVEVLIYQVERFNIQLLKQRVGYVLEQLDLAHQALDEWRTTSHRGGSSKLVGSEPFAPTFDKKWNLSLNAPVAILNEYSM